MFNAGIGNHQINMEIIIELVLHLQVKSRLNKIQIKLAHLEWLLITFMTPITLILPKRFTEELAK
jgi:hypothetical protein